MRVLLDPWGLASHQEETLGERDRSAAIIIIASIHGGRTMQWSVQGTLGVWWPLVSQCVLCVSLQSLFLLPSFTSSMPRRLAVCSLAPGSVGCH